MSATITQVAFKRRRVYEQALDSDGVPIKGVYFLRSKNGPRFYERPTIEGKQTWRRLRSTTPAAAQKEYFRRRDKLARFLAGEAGAENPYAEPKAEAMNVAALCDFYVQSGCPKRKNISSSRTTQTLREERRRVEWIKEWWGKTDPAKIELGDCSQYYHWRRARMLEQKQKEALERGKPKPAALDDGDGDRQVEKEIVTLSQILWWATRNSKRTGLKENPLRHDRPHFYDPKKAAHCRDAMPLSADELHALARMLFLSERSEVLGWQCLFQAMIGSRAHELLRLRWDAKTKKEAGFSNGRVLYLYESTSSKGTYEFARIHPALKQCLAALRKWRDEKFPESPWFFPSPEDPSKPVGSTALTHALARIASACGQAKRTSHGLRAYFVNVLRSTGISDGEVALRIGQKSGGKLIESVYGTIPEEPLSWMPAKGKPAWEIFSEISISTDDFMKPALDPQCALPLQFPTRQLELAL